MSGGVFFVGHSPDSPGIAVRSKVPTGKGLKPLVPQHVEVRSYLRGAIYLNAELKPLLIDHFSNLS